MRRWCIPCLVLLISACVDFSEVDKPLAEWTPELQQQEAKQLTGDRAKSMAVLLAFSGGGTRASAFAYGVLQELANTQLTTTQGPHSLLQEVDVMSSVSGGSFTAAYYGLHGEQIFTDFEPRFLRQDVEGALLRKVFNPFNWFRLLSGTYGRSDLAAAYYDKTLFDEATFADLWDANKTAVIINATDLATGTRFPFTESAFDLLCADLSTYPLSRAVAVSSAVPVVLSPVSLKNFAGSCGFQAPPWVATALKDEELTPRKEQARNLEKYLDADRRPFLHLVDGGVSDNLGLRPFYNTLSVADEPGSLLSDIHRNEIRQILIISVNARAAKEPRFILKRKSPSTLQIIRSVSADEIGRYSEDTIQIVRDTFEKYVREKATLGKEVNFNFVDVSINQVRDDDEREFLNGIGTNFDLKDDEVDRLIAAARKVLRESKEFQAFLALDHTGN